METRGSNKPTGPFVNKAMNMYTGNSVLSRGDAWPM